jgi:hypothetical protein
MTVTDEPLYEERRGLRPPALIMMMAAPVVGPIMAAWDTRALADVVLGFVVGSPWLHSWRS